MTEGVGNPPYAITLYLREGIGNDRYIDSSLDRMLIDPAA